MSQPFQKELELSVERPRLFNWLDVGDFKLSVQGGQHTYCTPRQDLPPEEYVEMEIGLFDWQEDWVLESAVPDSLLFLQEYWHGNEDQSLWGYVPVKLIQKAIDILRKEKS